MIIAVCVFCAAQHCGIRRVYYIKIHDLGKYSDLVAMNPVCVFTGLNGKG
jgi:hypothetical protein